MPFYKVPATSTVATGNSTLHTSIHHGHGVGGHFQVTTGDDVTISYGDRLDGNSNLAELTEADRDSELMRRDLEHRAQMMQGQHSVNGKIQHKREMELISNRKPPSQHNDDYDGHDLPSSASSIDLDATEEEVAPKYAHPSENRIVLELMEMRKREMELRGRWKEMGLALPEDEDGNETPFSLPGPIPVSQKTEVSKKEEKLSEPVSADGMERRENSSHVTPKVRPYDDPDLADDRKIAYIPANETPIEREIRLAREREDALRQARGLLPLATENQPQEDANIEIAVTSTNGNFHHSNADPNVKVSMKKLASNRLQLEMMKEKERELALRSQGAIHTISEERAGEPCKYVEVISRHQSDAPTPMSLKNPVGPHAAIKPTVEVKTPTVEVKIGKAEVQAVAAEPEGNVTTVNGRTRQSLGPMQVTEQPNELETVFGGRQKQQAMMSLKQKSTTTKPTAAERKILNELEEMEAREKELRNIRLSTQTSTASDSLDDNNPLTE